MTNDQIDKRKYFTPDYEHHISAKELSNADKETQIEVMRTWFFQHYEDPAQNTPHDSSEGGYIYIWGGPYDALEELNEEFEGIVTEEVIKELAEELNDLSWEWSGKPDPERIGIFVIDIRNNALSSLQHGIEHFVGEETNDNLKFAIIHIFHALELSLKARLAKAHRLLIYEKPEDKIDDNAKTVNFNTLIKRLENIGMKISEGDNLKYLQKIRNCIEHHQIEADREEVKQYIGRVAQFLDKFLENELNISLRKELPDKLYNALLEAIYSYKERREKANADMGKYLSQHKDYDKGTCPKCLTETLVIEKISSIGQKAHCFFCNEEFTEVQCSRCGGTILSGAERIPGHCDACEGELLPHY